MCSCYGGRVRLLLQGESKERSKKWVEGRGGEWVTAFGRAGREKPGRGPQEELLVEANGEY